jgi:hypothetical protein
LMRQRYSSDTPKRTEQNRRTDPSVWLLRSAAAVLSRRCHGGVSGGGTAKLGRRDVRRPRLPLDRNCAISRNFSVASQGGSTPWVANALDLEGLCAGVKTKGRQIGGVRSITDRTPLWLVPCPRYGALPPVISGKRWTHLGSDNCADATSDLPGSAVRTGIAASRARVKRE